MKEIDILNSEHNSCMLCNNLDDKNDELRSCKYQNYDLEKNFKICQAKYQQEIQSATLFENALKNCNIDKELTQSAQAVSFFILAVFVFWISMKVLVWLFKLIVSFISWIQNNFKKLTFRKIRKILKKKIRKFSFKKNITLPLKNWILHITFIAHILNCINWIQYFICIQKIRNIFWYNPFNTLLDTYAAYVKMHALFIFHYISLFVDQITLGTHFKLKEELHKNQSQLFILQNKYEQIEKLLQSEKRKTCITELRVKTLEKDNDASCLRIKELKEQHDFLKEHHPIVVSCKDEQILKQKQEITNQSIKIKILQKEHEENEKLKTQIATHEDIEEKCRKQEYELKTIKGTNNYLFWKSDDIVDWMIEQENGRYRCYENMLRENLRMECISGKHLTKLTVMDLYRLGIKNFGDKKVMGSLINAMVKNSKKKKGEGDHPQVLCDPIDFTLMKEPMFCIASGRTYEKKVIRKIIKARGKDPFSGDEITMRDLKANKVMKEMLNRYNQGKLFVLQ